MCRINWSMTYLESQLMSPLFSCTQADTQGRRCCEGRLAFFFQKKMDSSVECDTYFLYCQHFVCIVLSMHFEVLHKSTYELPSLSIRIADKKRAANVRVYSSCPNSYECENRTWTRPTCARRNTHSCVTPLKAKIKSKRGTPPAYFSLLPGCLFVVPFYRNAIPRQCLPLCKE